MTLIFRRYPEPGSGRSTEFTSIYESCVEPAHLAPLYSWRFRRGTSRGGRRQDWKHESTGGPMVTAVRRETRRDTNISLDKPIYTISVASEILETHPRTLMMYEHLGLVVPKRTSTNRRRFSQRDIRKLQAIQTLTRQHGVNLNGARYVLRLLRILVDNGLQAPAELRDLDVKELDV